MTYLIHEDFFPGVEKKLNSIAKKCKKFGNDFTFEVVGEEFQDHTVDGITATHKFFQVEVEGTAKVGDWECVAVMEAHPEGNIIRRINTEVEVPTIFRNSDNICEHCGTKRNRTQLFIIHNVETDAWKQVGGSCLKLYTGGLNMEYVVAFLDGITELEEQSGHFSLGGKCYYSVREVIGRAYEAVSKLGYFSADCTVPTKSIVSYLVTKTLSGAVKEINRDFEDCHMTARVSEADFYKAETEDAVDNIINYYKGIEDDSEFMHNIQLMLEMGMVTIKSIGILSFLPEGYNRYVQKEEARVAREKAREQEKSEHYGVVGNRYKDIEIKSINLVTSWEGQFGYTYIYKIVTADDFVLTWKTSNYLYLENGEKFSKITFTVKSHSEYRGQNQTEVTRCKVLVTKVA